MAVRTAEPGGEKPGGLVLVAMSPSESAGERWIYRPEDLPEGTKSICVRTPGGYVLETAIPLSALEKANPKWREEGVRINLAIDDQDGDQAAQLWWHPDWRTPRNLPGSGKFFPPENSQ